MPQISFACICPGQHEGAGGRHRVSSTGELYPEVSANRSSHCYIPPVISGSQHAVFPLQPARESWQRQDNILLQICSHQVIDEVRKTNTLKRVRLNFSLLNLWARSGLAQCKSSCWCSLSSSFRRCHFARASTKEGVVKTLQAGSSGWLPPSLVTANSTFSPTLSDSVCSQARGNRNTSLLFHAPSSPQQQTGKYYYFFFFKFSRPHTHTECRQFKLQVEHIKTLGLICNLDHGPTPSNAHWKISHRITSGAARESEWAQT